MIRAASLAIALLCRVFADPAYANDWKPIDPAHLAMKEPKVQPSADAEALLWEVRVSDDLENGLDLTTTFHHYLRVKIFTDRGREAFATVDIPYSSGMAVKDAAARTIRPDGSILELKESDIYRRTILKANDLKVSAVSFAVPAIEPGAIVEYRWREEFRDSLAANLRLRFSRDIPVHAVRYYIRPLAIPGYSMVAWPFNGEFAPPRKQENGFHMVALDNVPADVEETYGPPAYEQRPWVFIGYEPGGRSKSPDYYKQFAKDLYEEYSKRSRPNDEIRALAASAVGGAATAEARVAALAETAREKIRRVDIDTADPADLRSARESKNAAEALRRGIGTADDVVLLHAQGSLALIVVPERGGLVRMPVGRPRQHQAERRIEGIISSEGDLSAKIREEFTGRFAALARAEHQSLDAATLRGAIERRVAPIVPRARIKRLSTDTDAEPARAVVRMTEFEADRYAQAQGALLLLRLPFDLGGRLEIPIDKARQTAILVEPRVVSETVRLELPDDFTVDETPAPVTLEASFGRYTLAYSHDGGRLTAERLLETPMQTISPEQYSAARAFFERVRAADSSPVVLIRKAP